MAIISILCKTGILLVCSIIQVFGVLIEGLIRLLIKIEEYMEDAQDKMYRKVRYPKKKIKKTNIDVPL